MEERLPLLNCKQEIIAWPQGPAWRSFNYNFKTYRKTLQRRNYLIRSFEIKYFKRPNSEAEQPD